MEGCGLFADDLEGGGAVEEGALAEGDVEGAEEGVHGKVRAVVAWAAHHVVDSQGEVCEQGGRALDQGDQETPVIRIEGRIQDTGRRGGGGGREPRQQSRFPSEPAWAHSRHVGFQILVPRGQHPNVPQDRRVQHGDVVQVADDELGESGPLVGESPLSIRLDRTGVPDELLAQGEHELVLGDVSRVGIEAARYQLGIRSGTGVRYRLEELAEKSWGAGARRERHYRIGVEGWEMYCGCGCGCGCVCRSRDIMSVWHVSAKRAARTLSPEPSLAAAVHSISLALGRAGQGRAGQTDAHTATGRAGQGRAAHQGRPASVGHPRRG